MEDHEGNGGMSARRQLMSTGRGGPQGAQRAQRTHRTGHTGVAVPAGQAITCAVCRVQSAECRRRAQQTQQQRLWGPGPRRQPGPRWARPAHAPKAPCTGRAVGWRNLDRQTHSPVASSLPFLLRDIRRAAPVVCSSIAPRLHCSTAPLLHCSIAPFHHHPFTRSLDRPPNPPNPLAHSLTHPFTRSPAHPSPTHPPTHSPTHSLCCVGVCVGACVCALSAPSSPSLCFHTTTPRCSPRLCSPPSPALAHAAPTLFHIHAPIGLAASGPAVLFLGPHFFQPRLFSALSAAFDRARSLTRPSATNCCCTLHTTPNI
jgi:hypothetical protein